MNEQRPSSQAFSLVELLVVIAVILILLGILAPSLGRAREGARTAKCSNNLRQWGVAVQLYLLDYQQALPEEGVITSPSGAENPGAWFNALPPYVRAKPYSAVYAGNNARIAAGFPAACAASGYRDNWIWYCPTRLLRGKNTASNLNSFHYTFNDTLDGSTSFGGDAGVTNTKFGRIPDPAATVLLFESTDMQPEKSPSNNQPGPNLEVYIERRHGSTTANMLMADQHVESVRVTDALAVPILTGGKYVSPGVPRLIWGKFN